MSSNSDINALNLTSTELGYLADGFSAITIGGTVDSVAVSGDITSKSSLTFKDPTTFRTTGLSTLDHDLSFASGTNASFTISGPLVWNAGNITTGSGLIALNGNVTLSGLGTRALITESGSVTVGSSTSNTVTGAGTNLSITSGTQITTVNAALNNIGGLTLGSTAQRGVITVNNVITATSLTTSSANYSLVLNNGSSATSTIGTSGSTSYALTFLNTGALTLNNEINDTFIVLGSLTASAPSSVTASGVIQTAGSLTIASPLTMSASVTLNTAGDGVGGLSGSGYAISVTGGITAAANASLTLNGGSGSLTLAGAVASSGGTPTLQVVIADTQTGATGFNGNLSLKLLTTGTGSYDLSITGTSNSITDALIFRNTGSLQLGDSAGDTVTFSGGFTATVPNAIRLAGSIIANGPVSIGDSDTAITLVAATTINTSGASTISASALNLDGTVSGTGIALTLNSGLGTLSTVAIGSSGARLGAIAVIANEFDPTASIYGQSTLTIKPYTSGTAMIVGGINKVDRSPMNNSSRISLAILSES